MFEVRLLGPVRAIMLGREIALGGPKKRAVLSLLLLEAGRVVPAGRLIEELWRGSPPPEAAATLRSYVSRLRAGRPGTHGPARRNAIGSSASSGW